MNATITSSFPVVANTRDDGSKWITVPLPEGWDTLKKFVKKALDYRGENYIFRGWNSDKNEAYFIQSNEVAKIKSK